MSTIPPGHPHRPRTLGAKSRHMSPTSPAHRIRARTTHFGSARGVPGRNHPAWSPTPPTHFGSQEPAHVTHLARPPSLITHHPRTLEARRRQMSPNTPSHPHHPHTLKARIRHMSPMPPNHPPRPCIFGASSRHMSPTLFGHPLRPRTLGARSQHMSASQEPAHVSHHDQSPTPPAHFGSQEPAHVTG